jgi:hypothetical protein
MGKRIQVTDDLSVSFDQRAQGEETPWWVGRFWRKEGRSWKEVGTFENHGTGGMTFINPLALETELTNLVADQDKELPRNELADTLCYYAENLGYHLGVDRHQWTLKDQIDLTFMQPIEGLIKGDQERYAAANSKHERLFMLKKATAAARRGKTLVREGGAFFTYKTRDHAAIEKALAKRKVKDFEILA